MRWLTHLHFRVELEGVFFPYVGLLGLFPTEKTMEHLCQSSQERGK